MSDRIPLADARRARAARRAARRSSGAVLALLLVAARRRRGRRRRAHPRPRRSVASLPADSNGIVVLDLSASISTDTFARIGATLDALAGRAATGWSLFSDVAYEALPPGTPAAALKPLVRFFTLPRRRTPGLAPTFPTTRGRTSFSAGTRISSGLGAARSMLIRTQHLSAAR